MALTSDGRVYAWGLNNYGQIGHGTSGTHSVYNYTGDVAKYETPVIVMDLNNGRTHKFILSYQYQPVVTVQYMFVVTVLYLHSVKQITVNLDMVRI